MFKSNIPMIFDSMECSLNDCASKKNMFIYLIFPVRAGMTTWFTSKLKNKVDKTF